MEFITVLTINTLGSEDLIELFLSRINEYTNNTSPVDFQFVLITLVAAWKQLDTALLGVNENLNEAI